MQSGDEGKCIEVEGGAALALDTVIGWRWDGNRAISQSRNHGLISLVRGRAASGDQPTPILTLCNALRGRQ